MKIEFGVVVGHMDLRVTLLYVSMRLPASQSSRTHLLAALPEKHY